MRSLDVLRTLRCPGNALYCSRRPLPPIPLVHKRILSRNFTSSTKYSKPDDTNTAPDSSGDSTAAAAAANTTQSKPSSGFGKGWGSGPTFKRTTTLSSSETQIRDALVQQQRLREQKERELREAEEARARKVQAEREAARAEQQKKAAEKRAAFSQGQRSRPSSQPYQGSSEPRTEGRWNQPFTPGTPKHNGQPFQRDRPSVRSTYGNGPQNRMGERKRRQLVVQAKPNGNWECPRCAHLNKPQRNECGGCELKPDRIENPEPRGPYPSGLDTNQIQDKWSALLTKTQATGPRGGSNPRTENASEKGRSGWGAPRFDPSKFPPPASRTEPEPQTAYFRRVIEDPELQETTVSDEDGEEMIIIPEGLEEEQSTHQVRDHKSEHKKMRKRRRQGRGFDEDDDFEGYRDEVDDFERPRKKKDKKQKQKQEAAKQDGPVPIFLPDFISVGNLADAVSIRQSDFLKTIHALGFEEATYDHVLDAETAGLIAAEFNFEPMFDNSVDDLVAASEPEDISKLEPRPPVVTIMGHVDHGKTTILDWLRKSSVAASEHGGITQHIGAFSVSMPSGKVITFLDTPGHAAFLDMRKRGANVTDIVILVVAADDSVKPQTLEAIKHAKEAKVPIIVAINKIDKPDINIERVKQDLARHNVHVEDYGGDVQTVCVSGKTGQGMLELEEATVTLSEMLDHRANPNANGEGWIIEAATRKGGRVATVLVRRGTLRPGDVIVAGKTWARIRTLKNEAGVQVSEAPPGTPVSVDGWREQPLAGTEVIQAPDEQRAKAVVEMRIEKEDMQKTGTDMQAINEARIEMRKKREQEREYALLEEQGVDVEQLKAVAEDTSSKGIPVIIKADVSGSVEAIVNSVSGIGNNEVYPTILHSGVGPVGEFDVKYASIAKGMIITFNQPTDPEMSRFAQTEGVKVLNHTIIYELIDDVKAKLSEHLPPLITSRVLGEAEIAQIFEIKLKRRQIAYIAGCRVKNGLIGRSHRVKVLRGDKVVYDGTLSSLKNVKKDVTEMRKGTECGIAFENWSDFEVGDFIQTYEEISEKRYLP